MQYCKTSTVPTAMAAEGAMNAYSRTKPHAVLLNRHASTLSYMPCCKTGDMNSGGERSLARMSVGKPTSPGSSERTLAKTVDAEIVSM